jgi:hypothetical protein
VRQASRSWWRNLVGDNLSATREVVDESTERDVPTLCGLLDRYNPAVLIGVALLRDPVRISALWMGRVLRAFARARGTHAAGERAAILPTHLMVDQMLTRSAAGAANAHTAVIPTPAAAAGPSGARDLVGAMAN